MKIKNNMFSTNTSKSPITNTDFLNFDCSKKIYFTVLIILFYSLTIHSVATNDHRINNPNDSFKNDHRINNQNDLFLSNPSEWLICGPTSWQDLKNYLPEAKMAGISVSVMLLPPFQSTVVCSDGNYSEPFRNDYILWAQEIAKLSLRYSNLNSFEIADLQENIDRGYISQTDLLNILNASKSINPKLQFINTSTPSYKLWYVDRDATGNGDGTSWTNASTTVSGLPWNSIQGGDTVYISGGSDFKTYTNRLTVGASGNANRKIIITRGKDPGHSGEPIFRVDDRYSFYISGKNNLEISYLTFINEGANAYIAVCIDNYSENIDILHCTIYHPMQKGTAFIRSSGRYMYNVDSTGAINTSEETDGLDLYWTGNIEVAYNSFNLNNVNPIGHNDVIQCNNLYGDVGINKIHHNFAIQHQQGAVFYFGSAQGYWEIYNNILIGKKTGGNSVLEFNNSGDANKPIYAKIYNNTIVGTGSMYPIMIENTDSLDIKNNLIYKPDGSLAINLYGDAVTTGWVSIDYNRYYLNSTTNYQGRITGTQYSWAQWQALGYEAHGSTGTVSLVNLNGRSPEDFRAIGSWMGIDLGTNLTLLLDDFAGTFRPQGTTWDVGAFEFIP